MKKNKKEDHGYLGVGLAIGLLFGIALDNLGVGLGLGIVFGVALNNKKKSS